MSALDAAIAASCPTWCTRTRHPQWPGETVGLVEVMHEVRLYVDGDRRIEVQRWVELSADGAVVVDDTALFIDGFDHAIVRGVEVAKLAAALARAAELLAGVPA